MIEVLSFWVPGAPKTKGSLSARAPKCHCCAACRGYARLPQLQDSVGSKRWRKLVAYQAERTIVEAPGAQFPIEGPVAVELGFQLSTMLVDDLIAQGAGDLDKLYRNVLDALQDAGVYANDSQVTRLSGYKEGVSHFGGVRVRVFL